jgi:hypothetical protein
MHHSDVAASLETDADRRAFETERHMTDEERSGLISSLMVVVFGGVANPVCRMRCRRSRGGCPGWRGWVLQRC